MDKTEYTLEIFRGDNEEGEFREYTVPVSEGMVVLDAIHWIQANEDNELAVRWNCKAGRCGSCSMEINGKPKLSCMTRLDEYDSDETIRLTPMKSFPVIKDLVPDVSWNYEVNETIEPFTPSEEDQEKEELKFAQEDIERSREFRKCIECFLCQDVCHVLREHEKFDEFGGPRFFVRTAGLHFHPKDAVDRKEWLKDGGKGGVEYCNITRCCTEVCPENIVITDNAIIPLKEHLVDNYYDPLRWLWSEVVG